MAEFCNKKAGEWEEAGEKVDGDGSKEMEGLTDRVVKEAGDCCGVEKKKG